MPVDVVLLALLVAGFFVGFFRGVIRALMEVAAWAVSFLFAAHLRAPLGDWLAGSASFTPFYAEMVAFLVIFVLLFVALSLVVMFSRAPTEWARHQLLDDVLGGVLGVAVIALTFAALAIIFDSYYALEQPAVDIGWIPEIRRAFGASAVIQFIGNTLVPVAAFAMGPILPLDVRAVMV
jgi:uncharacterized membrane protein required for colicin V production